ncbi:hypothetical protein Taro_030298 [Colocasia esculenta]|uniref:Uncharacterized protein n=1 Tax=Colocasia esculenta TaxID=4460 RepID=A0A843VZU6_COLES|nr:hypothetical protein [Colocasia esculenta]
MRVAVRKQINNHIEDTRNLSWFGPSHMEVLRPVPKQLLRFLLTKGTFPLKDNTTPSTPAGLLLFPGQEGSPVLLQIVSHLVVFEVYKYRRKCLDKTMFMSKSSHTSMLPVFSQT